MPCKVDTVASERYVTNPKLLNFGTCIQTQVYLTTNLVFSWIV